MPDDHEELLRSALRDAVSGVRPGDRLAEIRRRTRPDPFQTGARRWPVMLGAAAATAAVFVGSAVIATQSDRTAPTDVARPSPSVRTVATPLYFLAQTTTGWRLFREFQSIPDGDDEERVLAALERLTVAGGPDDADYRTFWPTGSFEDVEVDATELTVDLGSRALQRPAGASSADARLALQQVVYTAQAVLGEDLPVAFRYDAAPADRVLDVPVSEAVARDRHWNVTAPVNISDPTEGREVDSDIVARGTASDWVTSVAWQLSEASGAIVDGGKVGLDTDGPGTLEFPGWQIDPLPVDDLAPGTYTLEVRVRDIGQTSDATATYTDTRTLVVR